MAVLDPQPRALQVAGDLHQSGQFERDALRSFLGAVRSHLVFTVFVVLATLGGAVAWLALRPSAFTAEAELVVTPVGEDRALLGLPLIRDLGDPARTIETAAAVVENRQIAAVAAGRLGPSWTSRRVLEAVDVRPRGQTNVLEVLGTGDNPRSAARIATVYARSVIEVRSRSLRALVERNISDVRRQLETGERAGTVPALEDRLDALELLRRTGDPSVSLAQTAASPASANGPPASVVLALALVFAVVLGAGAASVIDRLAPGLVLSESELHPLLVLGRVPRLRSRRRRPTPAYPTTDPSVSDAFRAVRAHLELRQPPPRMIMVTSAGRGDGRTTAALNLGVELAGAGREVVLIDLDTTKADLTTLLEEFPRASSDSKHLEGRDERILGAPLVPVGFQRSLRLLDLRPVPHLRKSEHLPQLLDVLTRAPQGTQFFVLDAPPLSEPGDVLPLLRHVDAVIVVVRRRYTPRTDLQQVSEVMARAHQAPTGCVFIGARR